MRRELCTRGVDLGPLDLLIVNRVPDPLRLNVDSPGDALVRGKFLRRLVVRSITILADSSLDERPVDDLMGDCWIQLVCGEGTIAEDGVPSYPLAARTLSR